MPMRCDAMPHLAWRPRLCRLTSLLLLAAAALMVALPSSAPAASPTALFWQLDGPSLVDGGADVPGQISGTPQVQRPTSLGAATRSRLRVDYTSQSPLAIRQEGATVAGWDSSVLSTQLCLPLGGGSRPSRWHLGLLRRDSSDTVSYRQGDSDLALRVASDLTALGGSYEMGSGWTWGALVGTASADGSAAGATLRELLDLPQGSAQWPSLVSDTRSYSLALSRRHANLGYGLQYDWSTPDQTLRLTRDNLSYVAPMTASAHGWEAYLDLCRGRDVYFLAAASHSESSDGSIYVGLAGRGDVQWATDDRRLTAGWRRRGTRATRQWVLDWRQSSLNTYDQGYAGLWPGLGTDVYALRSSGEITTTSVRYGLRRELGPQWSLLSGFSLQRAQIEATARLRQSQGIGGTPLTRFERRVDNGRMWLLAVTLGAGYQSGDWRAMFSYTGAYAEVNDAFSDLGEPRPDEPGGQLRAQGFWTMYFERGF